jgi:hypothetical protein
MADTCISIREWVDALQLPKQRETLRALVRDRWQSQTVSTLEIRGALRFTFS